MVFGFNGKNLNHHTKSENFISEMQKLVSDVDEGNSKYKLFAFELFNIVKFYAKNNALTVATLEKVLHSGTKEVEKSFLMRDKLLSDTGYPKKFDCIAR